VCELDIIFHSDKVNFVLDEICSAGMVLETNIVQILQAVHEQNKLHKKSEAVSLDVASLKKQLGGDNSGQRAF
jgi:AP-3 complex subunit sigma